VKYLKLYIKHFTLYISLVLFLMVGGCCTSGDDGLVLPDAKNCVAINNEFYELKWSVDIEVNRVACKNTYLINGIPVDFSAFSDSLSVHTQDIYYQSQINTHYPIAILNIDRKIKMKDFWPVYDAIRECGIYKIYHAVDCKNDKFIPQNILQRKAKEYQKQIDSMY